jgi:hypothetical protein
MRPIFTVHAGEYLVATWVEESFPDLRIWIPSKDSGIDLLVTDDQQNKVASLQVKFSKDYLGTARQPSATPDIASGGWWTLSRKKIASSAADLWVLVLYQFQARTFDFVVISPRDLLARYEQIASRSDVIQSYFWVTKHGRCWETRGLGKADLAKVCSGEYQSEARDFSSYLNTWPFRMAKRR